MERTVDLDQVAGLIRRHAIAWEPILEVPCTGAPLSIPDIERLLDRFTGLFR